MTYNIIYKHWQTPELKALYPKYFGTLDEATTYAETHRPRFWHVHKVTSTQSALISEYYIEHNKELTP